MQFQSDNNKSGLTFSFNDVNFDSSSLNLVPILLETPETEAVSDKYPGNQNDYFGSNIRKSNLYNDSIISSSHGQQEMTNIGDFNIPLTDSDTKVDMQSNIQECFPVNSYSDNFAANANFSTDSTHAMFDVQDNNLSNQYEPVSYYWFYCVIVNGLAEWKPFSIKDSNRIELKFCQYFQNPDTYDLVDDCVPTDGGRYDVFIRRRQKVSVYWEEAPMEIRRASWFYRPEDESFYLPYSESECDRLEDKFKYILENALWHQPFELGGGSERCIDDKFVFHSANTMVEYRRCGYLAGADSESVVKGRIVYRGVDAFRTHLEPGESDAIDHVMFVIHGIGPICDLGGRNIVDCVKSMRAVGGAMMRSHFPAREGRGRVELLPVSWHTRFHSSCSSLASYGSGGSNISIDRHLQKVTLQSVPKLRNFTNSTLVDVLCYSSPRYCATILAIVASEMNRLRHLFVSRNPQYDGAISILGHSLGSMIAMDLVALQESDGGAHLYDIPRSDCCEVPPLQFDVGLLFALGSPISLLLTARGHSYLGPQFRLERCKGLFNIFHPLDPIAYRLEPMLVDQSDGYSRNQQPPVVIAHHKGRKRLHLELKENLARVGNDIKSRLLHTLRKTWSSLQEFAGSHGGQPQGQQSLLMGGACVQGREEQEAEEMMRVLRGIDNDDDSGDSGDSTISGAVNTPTGVAEKQLSPADQDEKFAAQLNGGRRVDYVLQEAPLESFNDYLFALGSHSCYWESEDAVLMMLQEIYRTLPLAPFTRTTESPDNLSLPITGPPPLARHAGGSAPPMMHPPKPSRPSFVTDAATLPQTFQQLPSKPFFIPNFSTEESAADNAGVAEAVATNDQSQSRLQSVPQQVQYQPQTYRDSYSLLDRLPPGPSVQQQQYNPSPPPPMPSSDWPNALSISENWCSTAESERQSPMMQSVSFCNDTSDNTVHPQLVPHDDSLAATDKDRHWARPVVAGGPSGPPPPPLPLSISESQALMTIVDWQQSLPAVGDAVPPPMPLAPVVQSIDVAPPPPIMCTTAIGARNSNQSMNYPQYSPMVRNELVNVFQPSVCDDGQDEETSLFFQPPQQSAPRLSMATVPELPIDISATGHGYGHNDVPHQSLQSIFQQQQELVSFDVRTSAEPKRQSAPAIGHIDNSTSLSSLSDSHSDRNYSNQKIDPRPQRKLSQESYPCRTPSPRTLPAYPNVRNSPRSATVTTSSTTTNLASSIFSSRPLVPQSGRLFPQKK